jgi:RNA polymerase sigma factor (sigma-70 family)
MHKIRTARSSPPATPQLVAKARSGCPESEAMLFSNHYPRLLAIARSHALSDEDSADVAQRTWMKARASLDQLRSDRSFTAWISMIARNESVSVIRSKRRETAMPVEAIDDAFVADLDARLIISEQNDCLGRAMARLAVEERKLLKLLFEDGKDYREISQELDRPVGSIGPTRGRVLARLRAMIEPELLTA